MLYMASRWLYSNLWHLGQTARRLGSSWSPLPLMWQLSAPRTSVLGGLGRSCKAPYDLALEVLKLLPHSLDHENQLIEGEGN